MQPNFFLIKMILQKCTRNKMKNLINSLVLKLQEFPSFWDGKDAIKVMKDNGFRHWKQMEWIGFYFEYLCNTKLDSILNMPGPSFGNVKFDGFKTIPWDFKAHVVQSGKNVIVNDSEAISHFINKYSYVGLILACGNAKYNDANKTFKRWHDQLKGGTSDYEKDRIVRGAWSRLRKTSFSLLKIYIMLLDDNTLLKSGTFQENFRNADGSPRRSKLKINLDNVNSEIVKTIYF